MPALARDAVYAQDVGVLSGREKQPRYRALSPADRRAIVEILRETKPDSRPTFSAMPFSWTLRYSCCRMRPSLTGLLALVAGAILATVSAQSPAPSHSWLTPLREDATRLIKAATADDFAWQRLAELTDTYGNRLSGSENLTRAVDWAVRTMKADGLENVRTETRDGAALGARQGSAEIVDPPRHRSRFWVSAARCRRRPAGSKPTCSWSPASTICA